MLAIESSLHSELLDRRQQLTAVRAGLHTHEVEELIRGVDDALVRLGGGTYGKCDECDVPIESELLNADPLARLCLECLSPVERRALERDLETAAEIQSALLPESDYRFGPWEVHYEYRPLGLVSGDYCDLVVPRGKPEALYLLFGDISGKGVAASLLMSHLQALFRSLVEIDLSLAEMLGRMNRLFCGGTRPNSFATLVAAKVNGTGAIELCNAGHCPPLIKHGSEVTPVESTGLPFGLFADTEFKSRRVELDDDDVVLLYTDGLSEGRNENGEEYGDRRLSSTLEELKELSAEATAAFFLDDLAVFRNGTPRSDDLTVMAIRRRSN